MPMLSSSPVTRLFQSTLTAWGETAVVHLAVQPLQFQSTLPAWGETCVRINKLNSFSFQSTLPAWGETASGKSSMAFVNISIHSPRMGRDSKRTQLFEEKNWRICTTLYLFASKEVLPADKKTF